MTKKPGISAFISASSSNVWHKRGFAAFSQTRVNVTPQEFLLKNKKQSLSDSVEVVWKENGHSSHGGFSAAGAHTHTTKSSSNQALTN